MILGKHRGAPQQVPHFRIIGLIVHPRDEPSGQRLGLAAPGRIFARTRIELLKRIAKGQPIDLATTDVEDHGGHDDESQHHIAEPAPGLRARVFFLQLGSVT